jgi:pimeloyl-ACP methyl ester carboxylesterase
LLSSEVPWENFLVIIKSKSKLKPLCRGLSLHNFDLNIKAYFSFKIYNNHFGFVKTIKIISVGIVFLLMVLDSKAILVSDSMNVYLFPGQGSDYRIFGNLNIGEGFNISYINYPVPDKNMNMQDYARLLAQQIDTNRPFILIGVSLGGMLCSELCNFLHPEKVILISSAKCRAELPARYKFMKYLPVNKIIPAGMLKAGAFVAQPLFERDRNKEKDTFKAMLHAKNSRFLKRTISMIVNWEQVVYSEKIIHIHGNKDHTLPLKRIKADYLVENGSHMMALTRGDELGKLIQQILSK